MQPYFDAHGNTWKRQAAWLMAAAGALTLSGCLGSGNGGPRRNPTATPSATPTGTLTPTPTGTLSPTPTATTTVNNFTGRIVFSSTRDGNPEIYILDPFTTQRVTADTGTNFPPSDTAPVFNASGTRFAWRSTRASPGQPGTDGEIWIADVSGLNQQALTNNTNDDKDPAFAPNGDIAFVRDSQLRVINPNTLVERAITTGGSVAEPSFSRDGSKIVFTAARATGTGPITTALYTINSDGSGGEQLLVDDNGIESNPRFSSMGVDRIVYALQPEGSMGAVNSSIRVVNADGSNGMEIVPATASNRDPAWSPNSTQIVFASNRDTATTDYRLYRQNASAGSLAILIENNRSTTGSDIQPDWS